MAVSAQPSGRRRPAPRTCQPARLAACATAPPTKPLAPRTSIRTSGSPERERAEPTADPEPADRGGQAADDPGSDGGGYRPPVATVQVLAVEHPHGLVDAPRLVIGLGVH